MRKLTLTEDEHRRLLGLLADLLASNDAGGALSWLGSKFQQQATHREIFSLWNVKLKLREAKRLGNKNRVG